MFQMKKEPNFMMTWLQKSRGVTNQKNFESVSRFGAWKNNYIANLNDSWMETIFFIFTFGVFGVSERSKF